MVMILELDLTAAQLAGLAKFLADPGNVLSAPEGFNFLKQGGLFWHAVWDAPRPQLATLVRSQKKDSKTTVVLEVLEYALIGKTNDTIHDLERDAAVYFIPADDLLPLFASITRFPEKPARTDLSMYHRQAVL